MAESDPTTALLPESEGLSRDPKLTQDYSAEVDALFERLDDRLSPLKSVVDGVGVTNDMKVLVEEATDVILLMEKKARQASDAISVSRLLLKFLDILYQVRDWPAINEHLVSLTKKRGQLKRPIIDMTRKGIEWLDAIKDKSIKTQFIKTLAQISDGKIFVEVERGRLIRYEAHMLEEEGKVAEATALLQEVQVETFGSMERREKTEFILDQMRLVISQRDFVRCQIISKKINPKLLDATDSQDLKVEYYKYMVEYHLHEDDYFSAAGAYWSLYKTPLVHESKQEREMIERYVVYSILSRPEESITLLETLKKTESKKLQETPHFSKLIDAYLSKELVSWPLPFEEGIRSHDVFKSSAPAPSNNKKGDIEMKSEDPKDNPIWDMLRTRFIEHDILILSRYYSRLYVSRMTELIPISKEECEKHISKLVNDKIITCKIDRPGGIVVFEKPLDAVGKLDVWASNVSNLLGILQETSHLISNDKMISLYKGKTTKKIAVGATE